MTQLKRKLLTLWQMPGYFGYCIRPKKTLYPWHYLSNQYTWLHHAWYVRQFLRFIMTISWPFRCLSQSIKCWQRVGNDIAHHTHQSPYQLLSKQIFTSYHHNIPAIDYYRYGFYHEKTMADQSAYLYDHEVNVFFSKLNRFKQDSAINHKYDFFIRCQQNNLPTVPILGYYKHEQNDIISHPAELQCDLFSKVATGHQGKGSEYWRYIKKNYYQNSQGDFFSLTQLQQFLKKCSQQQPMILQPCLKNDPRLAPICNDQLLTGRLITAKINHQYEYLTGIIKLPFLKHITNNNGLSSPINPQTGVLGCAQTYRPNGPCFSHHPHTHQRIAGVQLPNWHLAKKLVCQAHQLFPDFIFLGWDVVFSDHGVLLLEVNQFWETTMIQLAHQQPLGKTRFTEICTLNLAECDR